MKQYTDWNTGVLHPKINSQQHSRIFCSTIEKVRQHWNKLQVYIIVLLDFILWYMIKKIKFQDQCCKDSRQTRNKKLLFPSKINSPYFLRSLTSWDLGNYPVERSPSTHWTGCHVGFKSQLGKIPCSCQESNSESLVTGPHPSMILN